MVGRRAWEAVLAILTVRLDFFFPLFPFPSLLLIHTSRHLIFSIRVGYILRVVIEARLTWTGLLVLDADTSVTQSALEEALLSNMQHQQRGAGSIAGGAAIASRMSSLSQALRSKYL